DRRRVPPAWDREPRRGRRHRQGRDDVVPVGWQVSLVEHDLDRLVVQGPAEPPRVAAWIVAGVERAPSPVTRASWLGARLDGHADAGGLRRVIAAECTETRPDR